MKKPALKKPPRGKPPKTKPPARDEKISPKEHGGPRGPEPTRYGDWEKSGRCSDF